MYIHDLAEGYRFTNFFVNHPNFTPFKPSDISLLSTYENNNKFLNLNNVDYDKQRPFIEIQNDVFDYVYLDRIPASVDAVDMVDSIEEKVIKDGIHMLCKLNLAIAYFRHISEFKILMH